MRPQLPYEEKNGYAYREPRTCGTGGFEPPNHHPLVHFGHATLFPNCASSNVKLYGGHEMGRYSYRGTILRIQSERGLSLSMSERQELEENIVLTVKERFGENLSAVVLFGSLARGETSEHSDIDVLVVLRKLPLSPVERRRLVYRALAPIRERYHRGTTAIEMEEGDVGEVTPLILNVASDGIVLYDKEGNLTEFLEKVRRRVAEVGLIRHRTRDGKYGWKLKDILNPGESFEIKV